MVNVCPLPAADDGLTKVEGIDPETGGGGAAGGAAGGGALAV